MRKPTKPIAAGPIEFTRADPAELEKFDPSTKQCTMNCGPHAQDPRTEKERRFLCGDCLPREPSLTREPSRKAVIVAWADDKAISGAIGNVASAAAKAYWERGDWVNRESAKRLRHPLYATPQDEWRAMLYAPLDGSKVELLIRHANWWPARKVDTRDADKSWEQICEGHWIDFNGGGWTWSGIAGTPIGWRPIQGRNT